MNYPDGMKRKLAPPRPDWFEQAKCRTLKLTPRERLDLFYPDKGENAGEAKGICHTCPVKAECRDYALRNKEEGVWGETSEMDRRDIRAGRPIRRRKPGKKRVA